MVFKKKKQSIEITLRNHTITYKEIIQFLKMTLDNRFNWKEYIDRVRAKVKRALKTIKVVGSKKLEEDQEP